MSSAKLFTPLKVGAITATNRVFMAPLTRLRSIEPGDIPTPLMAEYYRQRASAGLIISEATQISAQAKGYAGAPGLHSDEQIAAWKKITQGVHTQGGATVAYGPYFTRQPATRRTSARRAIRYQCGNPHLFA